MLTFKQYLAAEELNTSVKEPKTCTSVIKRSKKARAVKNVMKASVNRANLSKNSVDDGSLDDSIAKSMGYDFMNPPLIHFD